MKKFRTKRIFDFVLSLWGISILAPFFFTVSLIVKLTSKGPILYISPRVGQHGKLFNLLKFRTMLVGADKEQEGSITVRGDRRVTSVGKILRRFKIDELPSLFNVLMGEMSFVGPRPDVPGYADKLYGVSRKVLKLRPGITGPATLKYSNEEELLSQVDNPKKFNDEVIFPDKVRINLEYLENSSLLIDLKIIFKTIFRTNY